MNDLAKIFSVVALTVVFSSAAVNFPFPQNSNYGGNGVVLSNQASAAEALKSTFAYYMSNKYKESGSYAAIEKDAGSNTFVSEGIGYGMLMMVYFSDNTTSYQEQFNKLWAFYKAGVDEYGLMNWSFNGLNPYNNNAHAATDAEMDVAAALIMAAYQFGDESYLSEAKTLLQKVRQHEFESNGLHMPGDGWNDKKNPSYIAPAYYRLFADVDTDGATFWNTTAMNANYTLLETNSGKYSTGLFDNWTDASGNGLNDWCNNSNNNCYGYDAARTPWRLAQAFYWFGDSRATTLLQKLGNWVSMQSASKVGGSITTSGIMGNDHNSTFVATLMSSLVTDATHQSKLDEYWNEVAGFSNEAYFETSMKILNGLLVSGNMPNFAAGDTPSNPGDNPGDAITHMTVLAPSIQISGRTLSLNYTGNVRADLLSINGQVVKPFWNGEMKGRASVSLQDIPSGLYLVRIQTASGVIVQKLKVR